MSQLFHKQLLVAIVALMGGLDCVFIEYAYCQRNSADQPGGISADNGAKAEQASSAEAKESGNDQEATTTGVNGTDTFKVGQICFPTYYFMPAEKKLFYGLYLPRSFDKNRTYPLVVALHGLNGSPGQILAYPRFTKYADNEGYILVAPMGYNSRGWYGSRGTGGGRRSDPSNLGELSEQDVLEVLKLTRKNFKIDPNRIYLFGHSMGGGGSMHLATKYPELWSAIAVVAPAAYGDRDRLESAKNVPMYVVQGDKDRLVSVVRTRQWVEKMRELGMKHEYIEVKNGGHVFVAWQHFDGIFKFFKDNQKSAPNESVETNEEN